LPGPFGASASTPMLPSRVVGVDADACMFGLARICEGLG
jgi:hypothetical protein